MPAMPNDSGTAIFGASRRGRFLVTGWTVATASGIVVASRTRLQERSKLVDEATRSDW